MKKIDITTSHHVEIEYELANIAERFSAFIIDLVIIWAVIGISNLFSTLILKFDPKYTFYVIGIPVFFFYNLLFEIFKNGQSPGKKIIKIKVVKIDGKKSGVIDYFLRWCFRFIDIYLSLGSLAFVFISSSAKSQRIGDLLADTAVIKIDPNRRQLLNYILDLKNNENYNVTYPEIAQFSEDDVMLIKETLDRHTAYQGQEENILLLAAKLKEKLNITATGNNIEFLKTLIKDYVVMTR